MTELLTKYENVMKKYRAGEFGDKHLTLQEILSKGGIPNILKEMSVSELKTLEKKSTGSLRQVFSHYAKNR